MLQHEINNDNDSMINLLNNDTLARDISSKLHSIINQNVNKLEDVDGDIDKDETISDEYREGVENEHETGTFITTNETETISVKRYKQRLQGRLDKLHYCTGLSKSAIINAIKLGAIEGTNLTKEECRTLKTIAMPGTRATSVPSHCFTTKNTASEPPAR
jgi:hypothetical protein